MSRNLTILPADTYTVINKTVITSNDKKIITMLYQPIIGYTACSLYFTLLDDLDKKEQVSNPITHHHLMAIMQLKLEEIVKAREKLEAIGLLKSYLKKESVNKYVYLLFSPLSANEIFNHPILNIVLYNNLGKEEYDKLVNYYKVPRISLKDYEDITLSFDDVFSPVAGRSIDVQDDIVKKNSNSILLNKCIDFDFLISSIPKEMVNEKCFSSDIKELINSLAFTYNIDDDTMISLVRDSLNEKGNIDKTILRKSCRNYYQFEEAGRLPTMVYHRQPDYLKKPVGDSSKWAKMVYTFENISPYDYLRAKYKGAEPTARDLRLIENLLIDQKLAPGVVNVLLAYVLKINNQKLNKSYIETIVGQWKRLNIETVEDAMKITEKEHKKMKKIIGKETPKRTSSKKVEQLPAWFDKDLDKTTPSDEEQDELDRILQELV
jgi:DNA replication protein dnaB